MNRPPFSYFYRFMAAPFLVVVIVLPSYGASLLEEYRSRMQGENRPQVIAELRETLTQYPDDLDLKCLLAQGLAWEKDYAGAESTYQEVLRVSPNYPDAVSGMARLKYYKGDLDAALRWADRGLEISPDDEGLKGLRKTIEGAQAAESAAANQAAQSVGAQQPLPGTAGNYRYTLRYGGEHEDFSFTRRGNSHGLSIQDREFFGWNAGTGFVGTRRFGEDDVEISLNGARDLINRKFYVLLDFAGATKHILYPKHRSTGGLGYVIGHGFRTEVRTTYKRFDFSKVYENKGHLTYEDGWVLASAGGSVAHTFYDGGAESGGLGSYFARLQYVRSYWVKPWIGWARTKEAFEAGRAGSVGNFKSNYWSGGADIMVRPDLMVRTSYSREDRPESNTHVTRLGFGFAYSFGQK